ncbi:hypothetical protein BH23GEM9_BH23GEM9_26080 [soil metagenome]
MTWARQVLHVAHKDVRMARWLVLAYAAVVALATARAVGYLVTEPSSWGVTILLVAVCMLLVAVLVQGDSPARSDAFWVTRPLRPSAVFAAKLLGVLTLAGLALLGQALALLAYDIPAGDYLPQLARSALMFGLWLAAAGFVAALTRDLRMFVVAFVALLVASLTLVTLLMSRASHVSGESEVMLVSVSAGPGPGLVLVLLLIALVALVAHQYLTRHVVRGVVLGVGLVVALGAVLASMPPAEPAPVDQRPVPVQQPRATAPLPAALHASVGSVRLQVSEASRDFAGAGTSYWPHAIITIELEGASPAHRYLLEDAEAELHRQDGSVEPAFATVHAPPYPVPVPAHEGRAQARVEVTAEQAAELRRGSARIVLHTRMDVAGLAEVGALPLAERGMLSFAGRRVRIARVREDGVGGQPEVHVASSTILPALGRAGDYGPFPRVRDFNYTLTHGRSGEPLRSAEIGFAGGDFSLVLPGPSIMGVITRLQVDTRQEDRPAMDSGDLLRDAVLHVAIWQSLGNYPVSVTAAVVVDTAVSYSTTSAGSSTVSPSRRSAIRTAPPGSSGMGR